MSDAIKTFEHAGCTVEIFPDHDAESPRDWDNVGKLVCFHKRHNLGDEHTFKSDDYNGWDALKAGIEGRAALEGDPVAVILPVFLYDHSGLRIKVGSFNGLLAQGHAEFDSGQVGFIFCTVKQVADEWNGDIEKATKYLTGEIETYDQYLSGDVYEYVVTLPAPVTTTTYSGDGTKHTHVSDTESCCGFYGLEHCETEAKSAAEYAAKTFEKQKIEAAQHELAYFN